MTLIRKYLLVIILFTIICSCKKEKTFLYDVDTVNINSGGGIKGNVKSTTEFISIAYADLKGSNISTTELQNLSTVYDAFGDKKLIEDRIIRKFINDPGSIIPMTVSVNGDTTKFIVNTYKKFYNREPNEFEKYYLKEELRTNTSYNALIVYYSMMTSDEYRYY